MSKPALPERVKRISSVFSGNRDTLNGAIIALSEEFGDIDYISALIPFAYTDYYTKEFGPSLFRRFVSFENLVSPDTLPHMKLYTNKIEDTFIKDGNRLVNIDPGYISKAHLILATGKAYTHRPYIRDGIYADLTLIFTNHTFRRLAWTYPDYSDENTIAMFNNIRERYSVQLAEKRIQ
ncbi:MAG TPA: DUF4416 family protein [Syntrophales bacterium]|nr:DUF4416 family protein [Syntrophales bacterium]HPQ43042.1 DUF4416 family protein [Syntrophales bacterium]